MNHGRYGAEDPGRCQPTVSQPLRIVGPDRRPTRAGAAGIEVRAPGSSGRVVVPVDASITTLPPTVVPDVVLVCRGATTEVVS